MGINKIACIGSGLIGASWATLFAKEGYPVNLYDADPVSLERSKDTIRANLRQLADHDVLTGKEADRAYAYINFCTDLQTALEDADFIQENVPEIIEIKRKVLAEVDQYNQKAIFASSTSGMKISDIAKFSKYAERCIGAHPYNPPHLIPLVEITKGPQTTETTVQEAKKFYQGIKKEPVVLLKEAVGFIGNRLQVVHAREAINIVMEGIATLEDVDRAALYGPGLRGAILGPNLTNELNGGEEGIRGFYRKFGKAIAATLSDNTASWLAVPEEFSERTGPAGVEEEKRNRPGETGNTSAEIMQYRDNLLIEILKLHKKV